MAIEMLIALLIVHLPRGYAASGGGYEYVLLIGAAWLPHRHPWRRPVFGRPSSWQRTLIAAPARNIDATALEYKANSDDQQRQNVLVEPGDAK
jgi:hypothetical protein